MVEKMILYIIFKEKNIKNIFFYKKIFKNIFLLAHALLSIFSKKSIGEACYARGAKF